MMLLIQQYLQTHSLDDLEQKHHIHIKRHKDYPNLVLFKYDQINTVMTSMTRECRGIILDEKDDWKVICYSYKRFPNYNGESWGDPIDWESCRVLEKLDGSLCQLYYYDKRWLVSSSGLPDASGEVMGSKTTFADLFWKTWEEMGYLLPKDTNKSYAFELMTPLNRVVQRHKKSRLVLHGARDLASPDLKELNPVVEAHYNGWEAVKSFPFTDIDAVLKMANNLDPINEGEGFVLCDRNYHRRKIKSEAYRRAAHFRDSLSTRSLLDIVRHNEGDEALIGFEEYKDLFWKIKSKFEFLCGEVQGYYDAIKDIDDRKQFALKAVKKPYSGILFGLRDKKFDSVRFYLAETDIKSLEDWLKLKFMEL